MSTLTARSPSPGALPRIALAAVAAAEALHAAAVTFDAWLALRRRAGDVGSGLRRRTARHRLQRDRDREAGGREGHGSEQFVDVGHGVLR